MKGKGSRLAARLTAFSLDGMISTLTLTEVLTAPMQAQDEEAVLD